jgi:hypothetical protein
MSSYNQVEETRTLAETLGLATTEVLALYDECADLCATIAAQFPNTYENIAKYRQAHHALTALDEAKTVLDEPLERLDPPIRNLSVTVTIGKQTRYNRPMSQRVRLGNAVVRLKGIVGALSDADWTGLCEDLAATVGELEDVTFPERYG